MNSYLKVFIPIIIAILIGSITGIYAQTDGSTNSAGKGTRSEFGKGNDFLPPPGGRGPGGPGGPGAGLNPRLLDQLNLSDEQKVKIGKVQETSRASVEDYFEKLRVADDQLRELSGPDSFNEAKARQVLTAKSQITIELDLNKMRTDAAIYNLLTPEQISQAETLKSQQRPEGHRPAPDGFRPPPPAAN